VPFIFASSIFKYICREWFGLVSKSKTYILYGTHKGILKCVMGTQHVLLNDNGF
jgi:hypothetical protein